MSEPTKVLEFNELFAEVIMVECMSAGLPNKVGPVSWRAIK